MMLTIFDAGAEQVPGQAVVGVAEIRCIKDHPVPPTPLPVPNVPEQRVGAMVKTDVDPSSASPEWAVCTPAQYATKWRPSCPPVDLLISPEIQNGSWC